jgi:hypothetical protein
MSQAPLTGTSWCNESLPYPVNDRKHVRKVHPSLHTTGSDDFYWGRDFQPPHHIFNQKSGEQASSDSSADMRRFHGVARLFSLG